jgi:hypothetical protein
VIETAATGTATTCAVYSDLNEATPRGHFGAVDGLIVADAEAFAANRDLLAHDKGANWRSGIKHDCAAVMELTRTPAGLANGLGDVVAIEETHLYPLLKSTDLAKDRDAGHRMMIVPQRTVGEDTAALRHTAPATWAYLTWHEARFAARRSSIYRNRAPFAIFGVGSYTFAPWKVAISGLAKQLAFRCIGPVDGKPVVFDDTVSFLACATEDEARRTCALMNASSARDFLTAMIFWSDKRPITAGLLRRLDLRAVAARSFSRPRCLALE